MSTSLSFTAEEWTILRSAPQMVSMAVAGAGGGLFGAIKEAMAGGQAMIGSAQSRSALVQKLCTAEEIQAGQQDVQQIIMADPNNGTPEKLKALAVQVSAQAAGILAQKSPAELSDYQSLVMSVADIVANAAKEGGFLGFGGEIVSEGERDVMAAVQAALQGNDASMGGLAIPFPSQQPSQSEEPTVPQTPRVPQTPTQKSAPPSSSRSAGLPGLEPKSSTPPPITATTPKTQPKENQPKSSSSGSSAKSGLSSKSKTKGGFRSGSGLRKSDGK